MSAHRVPIATYRIQLHRRFDFHAARSIVPHLAELGITDLYLSPILAAREESEHGYDVVDPTRINPALGGEAGYAALVEEAQRHGMGVIVDIVPNHMAIDPENPAWMNVLEHGPASRFARWFDIHWYRSDDDEITRILVPVLGRPLDEAVREREIVLAIENGVPVFRYYEWMFPTDVGSWSGLLQQVALHTAGGRAGENPGSGAAVNTATSTDALLALASRCDAVPHWRCEDTDDRNARCDAATAIRRELRDLLQQHEQLRETLESVVQEINGGMPTEGGGDPMRKLLAAQPYLPCFWHRATREMSYRRFFDITHLIGVRVEDPDVFHETHERILGLVKDGSITGLRIDHIDGLSDPKRYLEQLQQAIAKTANGDSTAAKPFHILVEKILEGTEHLPESWPICGTTGYEFLNALSGIFIDPDGLKRLHEHAVQQTGDATPFAELVIEQKRAMAEMLFGGEIERLLSLLASLPENVVPSIAAQGTNLRSALIIVSAALPVYRTYIDAERFNAGKLRNTDRELIEHALERAASEESVDTSALTVLRDVLTLKVPENLDDEHRAAWLEFLLRWQQFTGPLMAKGLEDTALYRDVRLISLNEVGVSLHQIDSPGGIEAFHQHNLAFASHWPHRMTMSSTHDTKRSGDVRARLHVLSELDDHWRDASARWMQMNEPHRAAIAGVAAPNPALELLIYQSIIGAWPLEEDADPAEFAQRIEEYAIKAAREATLHTDWIEPNEAFENAVRRFVQRILNRKHADGFLDEMRAMVARLSWFGMLNGLAQTVLKLAAPGTPDFYRGTELWDFSLVDPDNRRPVDYEHYATLRRALPPLDRVLSTHEINDMVATWRDGRLKMLVMRNGLHQRRELRDVFLRGEYLPLEKTGDANRRVCAFARHHDGAWVVTAAPIRLAGLLSPGALPRGEAFWHDDAMPLPANSPRTWRSALTGRTIESEEAKDGALVLPLRKVFARLPVALLHGRVE